MNTGDSDRQHGEQPNPDAPREAVEPPPVIGTPEPPPVIGTDEEQVLITLDEHGRIDQSVACRECGYDLHGLEAHTNCPECGVPIARSLRSDRLMFSHPDWLSRVSLGIRLMVIGIVAYLVLSVMMFVIIAIVFANNPNAMRVDVVMLLSAVALVCSAVLTLAAWWLTTPEPGAIDQRPVNARTIGRWCMLAQLISGPLSMAGESINPAGIPTTPLEIMLTVIGGVMTIVAIVGYVALVLYLGKLAARLPARSLAQQHKIVGWGVGISQGLGAVAALIALLAMGATFAAGAVGFGMIGFAVTMCAAGLGSVVFGVWAFVLLIIMGFRLSDAARQARTAWGDDQEAPAAIT